MTDQQCGWYCRFSTFIIVYYDGSAVEKWSNFEMTFENNKLIVDIIIYTFSDKAFKFVVMKSEGSRYSLV